MRNNLDMIFLYQSMHTHTHTLQVAYRMIILMIYSTIAGNGEKTGLLFLFIFCALPINSKNWSHCFINGESGERFLEGEKMVFVSVTE